MSGVEITEFLLARIAETEAALEADDCQSQGIHVISVEAGARVLVECEAKRRIVERCSAVGYAMPSTHLAHGILAELATVYADHPDYRGEWAL